MIDRREILDSATTASLSPQVVEKDYVLGWLLAGIYQQADLAVDWIFKGGTCLKKCFFETYRFSEDLDFTLRNPAHLDRGFLAFSMGRVAEWVYEQSGLELPVDRQEFDVYRNPRGELSCRVKVPYRGPIGPRGKSIPNIKLDLTADDSCLIPSVSRSITRTAMCRKTGFRFWPTPIRKPSPKRCGRSANGRVPDLYDVVNLYRNVEARPKRCERFKTLIQVLALGRLSSPRCLRGTGTRFRSSSPG